MTQYLRGQYHVITNGNWQCRYTEYQWYNQRRNMHKSSTSQSFNNYMCDVVIFQSILSSKACRCRQPILGPALHTEMFNITKNSPIHQEIPRKSLNYVYPLPRSIFCQCSNTPCRASLIKIHFELNPLLIDKNINLFHSIIEFSVIVFVIHNRLKVAITIDR